jgi:hypothetical protein
VQLYYALSEVTMETWFAYEDLGHIEKKKKTTSSPR